MPENNFVIGSIDGDGFWSNENGWVDFENATLFAVEDICAFLAAGRLPSLIGRPVVIPAESVYAEKSTSPRVREARDFFDRMNKE